MDGTTVDTTYDRMIRLGDDLRNSMTLDEVSDCLVRRAVEDLGTTFGGITMIRGRGRRFETTGATHQVVEQADHAQYDLAEGPCVDAALKQKFLASSHLGTDERWPRWGPAAAELGLGSVLSSEIHARRQRIGALNLYGPIGREFTTEELELVRLYAVVGAAALGFATQAEHLKEAMDSRTLIGQAQGFLMDRYDIDAERAFEVMRRHSQDKNVRLVKIAQRVIEQRGVLDA